MNRAKRPKDLRLKIAILERGRTQRRVGVETRIGETRLSEIVNRRGVPPSVVERRRIAEYLGRPEADLFPPLGDAEADDDAAAVGQAARP